MNPNDFDNLTPESLTGQLAAFWERSGEKIKLIDSRYDHSLGSPVFTVRGGIGSWLRIFSR